MAQRTNAIWTKKGLKSLTDQAEYIAKYSGFEKGNLFQQDVIAYIDEKLAHPERYGPCTIKVLQENGFRCLKFRKKWVIVFFIESDAVKIFGIASSKQHPRVFEDLIK